VINVYVTATDFLITSTSTDFPVTVVSDNVTFTVTNQVSNFTVVNQTPTITFSTEGAPFDFASKNRGEWVSGGTYTRNDVVYYEYSTYICDVAYDVILTSTTPPPDDPSNWELFIFHEWPMAYLNVNTTATINGDLNVLGNVNFDNTLTVHDLTVENQFIINGLKYPINKGTYGQVLYTGGEETGLAAWRNLGELVFWSLSTDLLTNGFNITSGQSAVSPYTHPQLTLGVGVTNNLSSYIRFNEASSSTRGTISMSATSVALTGAFSVSSNFSGSGNGSFNGDLGVGNDLDVDGNVFIQGYLTGNTENDPVKLGVGGVRFSDGTVQTTAGTGTFTVAQIASTTRLGVIRVGSYLAINSATGVLSVDPDPDWTYTLPAATESTLGGIKVGYGLAIDGSGILNVTSSTFTNTQATNVSLSEDMFTNGYNIRSGTTTAARNNYVHITNGAIGMQSTGTFAITGKTIEHTVTSSTSYIKLMNNGGTTATSVSVNTSTIELAAPVIVAGANVYNSTLFIGRIYNYEGTSAPFFPAGVQYQDNTIQRTAWRGYDQGLI
jgi:hypothetical protein